MKRLGILLASLLGLYSEASLPQNKPVSSELKGPISDFMPHVAREFEEVQNIYRPSISPSGADPELDYELPAYTNIEGAPRSYVDEWITNRGRYNARIRVRAKSPANLDALVDKGFESLGRMQKSSLEKNFYAIGTEKNFLVNYLLDTVEGDIDIGYGFVKIGDKRFEGNNLVLKAILPNPFNTDNYALVIGGSSEDAFVNIAEFSKGDSDFVLYEGKSVMAEGYFDKSSGKWSLMQPRLTEKIWNKTESAHFTVYHNSAKNLDTSLLEERFDSLSKILKVPKDTKIRIYVYPTYESKARTSGDENSTHIDYPGSSIRTSARLEAALPYLAELMVYKKHGLSGTEPIRRGYARALEIMASGWQDELYQLGKGLPTVKEAFRKSTMQDKKLGLLFSYLIERHGFVVFDSFFRASNDNVERKLKQYFGEGFDSLEARLASYLETNHKRFLDRARLNEKISVNPQDSLSAALFSFNIGNFERAELLSREALEYAGENANLKTWAYFNLGRTLAQKGDIAGAETYLNLAVLQENSNLTESGERATVAARHWLGNIGKSQNLNERIRLSLAQSAEDFYNLDWDRALENADEAIALDSDNVDAHILRSEINKKKAEYIQTKAGLAQIDPSIYDFIVREAENDFAEAAHIQVESARKSNREGFLKLQEFTEEYNKQKAAGRLDAESLEEHLSDAEGRFGKNIVVNVGRTTIGNPWARYGLGITNFYQYVINNYQGEDGPKMENISEAAEMFTSVLKDKDLEKETRDKASTYLAYTELITAKEFTDNESEKISLYNTAVKHFDKTAGSLDVDKSFKQYAKRGLVDALVYLGYEEFNSEDYSKAKKHFTRALSIIKEDFPELEFWKRLAQHKLTKTNEMMGD